MYIYELSAIVVYFLILLTIGYYSYRKNMSVDDFIIGNRSMNYWLTALSAHASDMSSWLFLAYPAAVFTARTLGSLDSHWTHCLHVSKLAMDRT